MDKRDWDVAYEIPDFWPPVTNSSEDIGSGSREDIGCGSNEDTAPSRPATSAPPPHKFLHFYSNTKVRLPTSPLDCVDPGFPHPISIAETAAPHDPPDCFANLTIAQAEHPD